MNTPDSSRTETIATPLSQAGKAPWENMLSSINMAWKMALMIAVMSLGAIGVALTSVQGLGVMRYHLSNIYDFMLIPIVAINQADTSLADTQLHLDALRHPGLTSVDQATNISDVQASEANAVEILTRYDTEWVTTSSPEFTAILRNLGRMDLQKDELSTLAAYHTAYDKYVQTRETYLASVGAGTPDDQLGNQAVDLLAQARQQLARLIAVNNEFAQLSNQAAVSAYRQTLINTGLAFSLTLLLGLAASYVIARSITWRLGSLADAASSVQQGNLTLSLTVSGQDEIAKLSKAFNAMTTQLRDLIGTLEQRVQARTAQLSASAEVARAASSILDPQELLQKTVDLIRDRFGFYYAGIFLLDDEKRFACLRAGTGEAGQTMLSNGHKLEVTAGTRSMVGWVCVNRQARIALDVGADAVRFANPLLPDTRSEIALPLQAGGRLLGALDVQSTQAAAFDESDIAALQGMADQIAVALENARLFTQTQATLSENERLLSQVGTALREATALYEAGQAISTASDNTAVFQAIVDHVLKPEIDLCLLMSFEPYETGLPQALDISHVWTRAGQPGHPGAETLVGSRFEMARFPLREFLRADQSQVIRSRTQLPINVATQKLWERLGVQALALVPLNAGGRWIGALWLGAASEAAFAPGTSQGFAPEALRSYQAAANQVAVAIENRRLYESAQTNLREMSGLYRTFTRGAWERALQARPTLSEYDYVAVPGAAAPGARVESQDDDGLELRVPLKLRDQEIGYLELAGDGPAWTEQTRMLVEAVSAQVALALESARLFDQTQRLAGRERLVNEITSRIRATSTVPDILQTAARELAAALNVPHAVARIELKRESPSGAEETA